MSAEDRVQSDSVAESGSPAPLPRFADWRRERFGANANSPDVPWSLLEAAYEAGQDSGIRRHRATLVGLTLVPNREWTRFVGLVEDIASYAYVPHDRPDWRDHDVLIPGSLVNRADELTRDPF